MWILSGDAQGQVPAELASGFSRELSPLSVLPEMGTQVGGPDPVLGLFDSWEQIRNGSLAGPTTTSS